MNVILCSNTTLDWKRSSAIFIWRWSLFPGPIYTKLEYFILKMAHSRRIQVVFIYSCHMMQVSLYQSHHVVYMIIHDVYRHSLSVTPFPIICHSVPLSICLSVCPAIKAYIWVTIRWILMKLGESVGT